MQKLCINCLYIGTDANQEKCNVKKGLGWILGGLLSIILILITPYALIITWLVLMIGLNFILICYQESNVCPKCNSKNMVDINGDNAKRIITENKIEIPKINSKPRRFLLNSYESTLVIGPIYAVLTIIVLGFMVFLIVG